MSDYYLLNEVRVGVNLLRAGQIVSDVYDNLVLIQDAGGILVGKDAAIEAAAERATKIYARGQESWVATATMIFGYMLRSFVGPIDYAAFNALDEAPSYAEGRTFYKDSALNTMTEFGDVTIKNGEELQIPVVNKDSIDLSIGTPVYSSGKIGKRLAVKRPDSVDPATMDVLGLLAHDVAKNHNGRCTSFGLIRDVPTDTWSVNDHLYVDGMGLVNVRPVAPGHYAARVADVVRSHPTKGVLAVFVHIDGVIAGVIRPTVPRTGEEFFDTNLGLPLWWTGAEWTDAAGVTR